jgi:hypothetical protein
MYIALGARVLRIPGPMIRAMIPVTMLPTAASRARAVPHPEEPLGCFGHPWRMDNVTFGYLYRAMQQGKLSRHQGFDRIDLVAVAADYWGVQDLDERRFRRLVQADYMDCVAVSAGFTSCIDKRPYPSPKRVYQAATGVYAAPFGRPFTVDCLDGQGCRVQYKLYPDLNLSYQFHLALLPVSRLMEEDRRLRAQIAQMQVPHYPWQVR